VPAEPRPRWPIDAVLDRTDLARLLDELAEPAGSARIRKWHCPVGDHDDHHASVTMHRDARGHERWRCWSGDNSHRGDAIDLAQVVRRTDRRAAIDWLAGRVGLHPDIPLPPPVKRPPTPPPPTRLDESVTRYARACHRILDTTAGRPIRAWLEQRGLHQDVVRANLVGADPGRRQLARPRGLPFGAGNGATFPALDQTGQIAYVQTRYLDPPPDRSKYENPAAYRGTNPRLAWTTPVGHTQPGSLIICEGIPDALTAAQAGYHAVAVLGSQAPDTSVATRLASRAHHDGLTLVAITDNDNAGHHWGHQLTELLDHQGHDLHVVEPPEPGLDLNAWAQTDDRWTTALPASTPSQDVELRLEQGPGRPAIDL
jgi:hypothetical protein